MEILALAALLGLIPAAIAKGKGYSFGGWWVYGTLLLIVALPHALLIKPNMRGIDERAIRDGFKKCPFCAEIIRPEALICKHCGKNVPAAEPAPWLAQFSTAPALADQSRITSRRVRAPAWQWVLAIGGPCLVAWVLWLGLQRSSDDVAALSPPLRGQQQAQAPEKQVQFIATVDNEPNWDPNIVPENWPRFTVVPGEKPPPKRSATQAVSLAVSVEKRWQDFVAGRSKSRPTRKESGDGIKALLAIPPTDPKYPEAWAIFIRLRKIDRGIGARAN